MEKIMGENKHIEYLQTTIYVILLNIQICPKPIRYWP